MPTDWPFSDPENLAVFTLKRIIRGESPILRVTHDEEDGGWQFLDGGEIAVGEACLISLRQMTRIEPGVLELADVPLGRVAERAGPGEPWQMSQAVTEADRERKLVSDFKDVGWHVVIITEDDERPSFAYSIGLFKSFGHPEVILFGLNPQVMHQSINVIGEQVSSGRHFAVGQSASGIPEGYGVRFVPAARRQYPEYLGYAHWFFKGDDFLALQLLWPDKQGRFPTDADYAERLRARQPFLVS